MKRFYTVFVFFSLILAMSACKKNHDEPSNGERIFDSSLPSGNLVFSQYPVDPYDITFIIALGHQSPPGHTRPSDHMYFVGVTPGTILYAPVSGKVLDTFTFDEGNGEHDNRITIGVTSTSSYYFMHVLLDSGIKVGDKIKTGQRLGIIGATNVTNFDMGVMLKTIHIPFLDTALYGPGSLYCDSPIKHYPADMQAALYARVQRTGDEKDGKICYDEAGKLSGNWIAEAAKSFDPLNADNYESYFVSFAYGCFDPSRMIISIGNDSFFTSVNGNASFNGDQLFYVQDGAEKFETITPASGKATYKLYGTGEFNPNLNQRLGLLIVQMMDDQKIKIEFFDDTLSDDHDFTSNAKIYVR